jgi:hypothetical protein
MARCPAPREPIDDAMRNKMALSALKSHRFTHRDHLDHWSAKNTGLFSVALGLPILSIEAWPIDKPNEVAFVRNGFFLSASGELHSEGQMSYDCNLDLSAEPSH